MMSNSLDELWTLLNFVDKKVFANKDSFTAKFGELKSAAQLQALHAKLKPYLLRREKEHVEKSVPPKQEVLIEVELTAIQKQYYRAIYEQKTSFLCKKEAKDGPSLSNLAMELRKCCLHLFLIKGAEAELYSHFKDESAVSVIVKASAKMTLLDKLLPKLKAEGHRVLIFSQFRIMLDIIEDYLDFKQHRYGTHAPCCYHTWHVFIVLVVTAYRACGRHDHGSRAAAVHRQVHQRRGRVRDAAEHARRGRGHQPHRGRHRDHL